MSHLFWTLNVHQAGHDEVSKTESEVLGSMNTEPISIMSQMFVVARCSHVCAGKSEAMRPRSQTFVKNEVSAIAFPKMKRFRGLKAHGSLFILFACFFEFLKLMQMLINNFCVQLLSFQLQEFLFLDIPSPWLQNVVEEHMFQLSVMHANKLPQMAKCLSDRDTWHCESEPMLSLKKKHIADDSSHSNGWTNNILRSFTNHEQFSSAHHLHVTSQQMFRLLPAKLIDVRVCSTL